MINIFAMHKSWIGVTVLLLVFVWIENPVLSSLHPAQSRKRKGNQASDLNVKEIRQQENVDITEKMRIGHLL